jgi:hypothetical protein
MCLIAVSTAGAPALTADELGSAWKANPHGAGYMFSQGGTLIIRKAFYKLAELTAAYHADHLTHGASSAFVLHFRWATHGDKSPVNVHPHELCGGAVGLAHNGVLPVAPPFGATISDTVFFCRTVLAAREPAQIMSGEFRKLLSEMIGERNKFVLMSGAGELSIVNEELGTWEGGIWFSNLTWRQTGKLTITTAWDDYEICSPSSRRTRRHDTGKLPVAYAPRYVTDDEDLEELRLIHGEDFCTWDDYFEFARAAGADYITAAEDGWDEDDEEPDLWGSAWQREQEEINDAFERSIADE